MVVPDYRVYPEVRFPGFLEDGAQGRPLGARQRGAIRRRPARHVSCMGHSAGAHIAAMLALDAAWLERPWGSSPGRDIAGLIGVSGPYDFLPLEGRHAEGHLRGRQRPETQPITFGQGGKPPALLVTGADDTRSIPAIASGLAAKLRAAATIATVIDLSRTSVTSRSSLGLRAFRLRSLSAAERHRRLHRATYRSAARALRKPGPAP